MSEERTTNSRDFDIRFFFASYGVTVEVEAAGSALLEKGRRVVTEAFGRRFEIFEGDKDTGANVRFGLEREGGKYWLYRDGVGIADSRSEKILFKYFNSMLRLEVAEHAVDRVFIHAGVVGWNGSAMVLPGTSFAGKSTLTAELVRLGAEYYSDEYAVVRPDGLIEPFPRHLSIRTDGGKREITVSAEEIGGRVGTEAIAPGMVLFTSYQKRRSWMPEILTAGDGIMELIPNTLSFRRDPAFSLKVLDLVAQRAIMVRSPRGDARKFAKFLLEFFENNTKLARIT